MPGFSPVGTRPVDSFGGSSVASGNVHFYGSNVLPSQLQLASGHLLFGGSAPVAVLAAPRVTWLGFEALHLGAASPRVTWTGIELLRTVSSVPALSQVSWIGVEALHNGAARARVTWLGAEVAHIGKAMARLTWMGVEVLRSLADMPPDTGFVYLICG